MGIFDSFRKPKPDAPAVENGAALQLLLAQPLSSDISELQTQIRAHDAALKAATVTGIAADDSGDSAMFVGEVAWGAHRVHLIAMPFPMPDEVVEKCVQPAPYGQDDKTRIRAQNAHVLLNYKGQSANVTEQFVAVAVVAGALCGDGGLAILNEGGRTSLPATILSDDSMKPSQFWRSLPPLYLFAGFVKYEMENSSGVWMRTHGLEIFDLPNLATLTKGHHQGQKVFDIFNNVVAYMMEQGPVLAAGHTMQIAETQYMKLRDLSAEEAVLDDGAPVLVAEFIDASEVNEHIYGSDVVH